MNFYSIDAILNTVQSDVPSSPRIYDTNKKTETISTSIGSGFCGPNITALRESAVYDATETSRYISTVLEQLNQEGAYGILAGVSDNNGPVIPTFIIGVPGHSVNVTSLPPPPRDLPVWIKKDEFISMPGEGGRWALTPVSDPENITLDSVSIGLEGSLKGAGSFCGFVKKSGSPGNIFGMTAAHCLPGGGNGMSVCAPSTVEVSSRFKRLLRYTTFCPPSHRLHFTQDKQTEVESILNRYRFNGNYEGIAFIDPKDTNQLKKGVFSGRPIGELVSYEFGEYPGLIHAYDQMLHRAGKERFFAGTRWKSRMDWAIFSCDINRYGGNVCQGEPVSEIGYLYPFAKVEKIGRSTGLQRGRVNPIVLQHWESGTITYEISIIGKHAGFADVGDSGACVMVKENGRYKAAGMLTGKTKHTGIVVATPVATILASAVDYMWA